jgi:hypothetical protein
MPARTNVAIFLLVGTVLVSTAAAQILDEATLQKKLDTTLDFEASNMPIEGVFAKLSQQTGVRFVVTPDALDMLPYGSQTRLDVEFQQVRLREAIDRILAEQALDWQIRDGKIQVVPSAPLKRMIHRPSFDELSLLSAILSTRLEKGDSPASALEQLREATGEPDLRIAIHVPAEEEELLRRAQFRLPGTGRQWLDTMTHGKGWTWYLAGDTLVVLARKAQIQRQMQSRVTLRYRGAKLVDVLLELASAAGARLHLQPGVLSLLPETQRENLNLIMAEATVDQALEVISGATGLVFEVVDDGIMVSASEFLTNQPVVQASPKRERPPFFVKESMKLGSSSVEIFYPADELPEDVIEKVLAHRKEMIENLRKLQP